MTAMAHEPLSQEEVLLEGFLALDTPEGFRAELIEGEIVVTPPPDGDHERYISGSVLVTAAAPKRDAPRVPWSARQTSRADGRVESP